MLTQNKKRLFDKEKSEYTFRSLNSIISSMNYAKEKIPKVELDIIIIDYNSKKNDLEQLVTKVDNINTKVSDIDTKVGTLENNSYTKTYLNDEFKKYATKTYLGEEINKEREDIDDRVDKQFNDVVGDIGKDIEGHYESKHNSKNVHHVHQ